MFWEKRADLKTRIAELETVIKRKDLYISELEKKLSGENVCSGYCAACSHGIIYPHYTFGIGYLCDLKVNCKDFMRTTNAVLNYINKQKGGVE